MSKLKIETWLLAVQFSTIFLKIKHMKTILNKLSKQTKLYILIIILLFIITGPFILDRIGETIVYYSRMRCPGTEVVVFVRDRAECVKYYTR
jgi:hypothetical protein